MYSAGVMWAIGAYRLDPASFELRRDGELVELQRRPLDLLLYLVARPQQIVTREELQTEIWSGVVVSEGALSTAVYEARAAIGDLERAPADRWIETVRGRGFRFRGPLKRVAEAPSRGETTLFVGRTPLLEELMNDVHRLREGRGGVRVVEGIAGMGKTRLVQEATRHPGSNRVHSAYCERGGPPYWPWVQLVRALAHEGHEPGETESGWLTATSSEDDVGLGFERADRMVRVLASAAERAPRIVVLEDLHWADAPSLALLESLTHRLIALPVLILATRRVGEEAVDRHPLWTHSPHLRRDRLEPLSVADLYGLVRAILGRRPTPEFIGWIHAQSGGVPLIVRELSQEVYADEAAPPDVPQLAHQVLGRRLDGLSPDARTAVAVAALCGERFDLQLVEAAADGRLGGSRRWVREAIDHGILLGDPRHPLRFAFRHSLLRDAARGELGAEDAARWHGRLARVLEQQHPEPTGAVVSLIAHHAAAATLVDTDLARPLRYALLAARNASEVFAWEDVRVHSEHALDWVPFMPPGLERDAQEIEATLLHCAGITPASGHVEETAALLERIEPILARTGDPQATALAAGFRFANARSLGDFATALDCADRMADIDAMAPIATCWRFGVASLAGDLAAAVTPPMPAEALDDVPHVVEFARLSGRDPEIDRLGLTAFASFFLGRDADALERAERAVQCAEDRGDARSKIWAMFMLCMLHELRHDWPALDELAIEVDTHSLRYQITPWLGVGTALSSWARACEQGQPDDRGAPFAAVMRDRGRSSNVSLRTMLLLLASRIFVQAGKLEDAEQSARDGLDFATGTDERHMLPELERQLGRILEVRGRGRAAREARDRALRTARSQGNVVSELRTLADRIDSGEAVANDRARLAALRSQVGSFLCPSDRALLEGLSVG